MRGILKVLLIVKVALILAILIQCFLFAQDSQEEGNEASGYPHLMLHEG